MIKKGSLLIAEPNIFTENNFSRSVILLVEHNQSGSVGFILNKKLEYSTKELLPDLKYKFPIYNGGPVEKKNLYFIHNKPKLIKNSFEIKNGIYWGGDFTTLKSSINENKIKINDIKFFIGYSGWEENQIEEEMNSSSWIIKNESLSHELLHSCNNIWRETIIKQGGDYLIWANLPENPNYN